MHLPDLLARFSERQRATESNLIQPFEYADGVLLRVHNALQLLDGQIVHPFLHVVQVGFHGLDLNVFAQLLEHLVGRSVLRCLLVLAQSVRHQIAESTLEYEQRILWWPWG